MQLEGMRCLALLLFFSAFGSQSASAVEFKSLEKGLVKIYYTKEACTNPSRSYGSGFFISENGLVATNYHVVSHLFYDQFQQKDIGRYCIEDHKGERLEIDLLGGDPFRDLAILKADYKPEFVFDVNAEPALKPGDEIWAVGNPEGLGQSITKGEYNGVREQGLMRLLNYTAPVNSGMSGGPVVDSKFRVVGMNASVFRWAENLSFGVPRESLMDFVTPYLKGEASDMTLKASIEKSLRLGSKKIVSVVNKAVSSDPIKKHDLKVLGENKNFECHYWTGPEENHKYEETQMRCSHWSGTQIERYMEVGRFHYEGILIKEKDLTLFKIKSVLNDKIAKNAEELLQIYKRKYKPTASKPKCGMKTFYDSEKRLFKLVRCYQPYTIVDGAGDFSINISSVNDDEDAAMLQVMYGSGVSLEDLNQVEESLVSFFKKD